MSTPTPGSQSTLLTTTSLSPQSANTTPALPNLPSQQTSTIDSALSSYSAIRSQYLQLIDQTIKEQDPSARAQLLSTVESMNKQLTTIVASIQQMYDSGTAALSSSVQPADIQSDVANYKKQLAGLQSQKDEITKLKMLYASLHPSVETQSYYIYIVAILVLLIVILMLFTFSSLSSSLSAALPAMPAMPELPSLGPAAPVSSLAM